MVELDLKFIS